MISAAQIRSARALLEWTQEDVAKKSGLSLRAFNSIERNLVIPRIDNVRIIQEVFENENIEFLENDGVRRKTEKLDVLKFEGKGCLGQHLLDIIQELRTHGGEVLFSAPSEKNFAKIEPSILDEYFAHIFRNRISERVLFGHGETFVIGPPPTYRWLRKDTFTHVSYCVYADNVAYSIPGAIHRVIITRNPSIADMFRKQFEANWKTAEIPWFAKKYKNNSTKAWSSAQAQSAREWVAKAES